MRNTKLQTTHQISCRLTHSRSNLLSSSTLHSELRHSVGHLLEENRAESRVESANQSLFFEQTSCTISQTVGKTRSRHQTNACGFKRAQEDISAKLGHSGRSKIDCSTVIPSGFFTNSLSNVNLKKLNTTEFEPSLDEVTETSEKCSSSFFSDNLLKSTNKTSVILHRVQLDTCLDDIHRCQGSMSHGTANTTS